MRQGETPAPANIPTEKGIPTLITWSQGGNTVAVEGSWDNWLSREVLQHAGKDHTLLLVLPSGIFHYRFIVDGEVRQSPDHPFVSDEMGNVCHVLDVHDYVPETLDSISEFETPGSPDSSYNQDLPEEDDFSRDPVLVPQQLHLTVLDVPRAEEISPSRPQHVVLNHLYLEKGRAAQSIVALGLTHRFESKYVTVVLYKPLQRTPMLYYLLSFLLLNLGCFPEDVTTNYYQVLIGLQNGLEDNTLATSSISLDAIVFAIDTLGRIDVPVNHLPLLFSVAKIRSQNH
ncbi:hypothetical protein V2J09_002654 [Rumex salicifolius]